MDPFANKLLAGVERKLRTVSSLIAFVEDTGGLFSPSLARSLAQASPADISQHILFPLVQLLLLMPTYIESSSRSAALRCILSCLRVCETQSQLLVLPLPLYRAVLLHGEDLHPSLWGYLHLDGHVDPASQPENIRKACTTMIYSLLGCWSQSQEVGRRLFGALFSRTVQGGTTGSPPAGITFEVLMNIFFHECEPELYRDVDAATKLVGNLLCVDTEGTLAAIHSLVPLLLTRAPISTKSPYTKPLPDLFCQLSRSLAAASSAARPHLRWSSCICAAADSVIQSGRECCLSLQGDVANSIKERRFHHGVGMAVLQMLGEVGVSWLRNALLGDLKSSTRAGGVAALGQCLRDNLLAPGDMQHVVRALSCSARDKDFHIRSAAVDALRSCFLPPFVAVVASDPPPPPPLAEAFQAVLARTCDSSSAVRRQAIRCLVSVQESHLWTPLLLHLPKCIVESLLPCLLLFLDGAQRSDEVDKASIHAVSQAALHMLDSATSTTTVLSTDPARATEVRRASRALASILAEPRRGHVRALLALTTSCNAQK
jgi:hypothetical protein